MKNEINMNNKVRNIMRSSLLSAIAFVGFLLVVGCEKKEDNSEFCTDREQLFGLYKSQTAINGERFFYEFNETCGYRRYAAELQSNGTLLKGELLEVAAYDYFNGILNVDGIFTDAPAVLSSNGRLVINVGRGTLAMKKLKK